MAENAEVFGEVIPLVCLPQVFFCSEFSKISKNHFTEKITAFSKFACFAKKTETQKLQKREFEKSPVEQTLLSK